MAFRAVALGVAAGAGFGAASMSARGGRVFASDGKKARHSDKTIDGAAAPDAADDSDETPVDPVKVVVIGGGYAGARIAYQLDSVFHLTLVDTKNYYEASDEISYVLNGPDHAVQGRLEDVTALHRYYLRRARVITSTAVDVDEDVVKLIDGREVPYDMLIMATGETRPFPFHPSATTADVREAELKAYRALLRQPSIKKVAVVGGGARGCSFASTLSCTAPDKEIHLFQSTSSVVPHLPYEARNRATSLLELNPSVTVHLNSVVENIEYTNEPAPGSYKPVVPGSYGEPRSSSSSSLWGWLGGLFGGGKKKSSGTTTAAAGAGSSGAASSSSSQNEPTVLLSAGGTKRQRRTEEEEEENSDASKKKKTDEEEAAALAESRHAKVGAIKPDGTPMEINYEVQAAESTSPFLGAKYKLDVSLRGDMKADVPSVVRQAFFGDLKQRELKRGPEIGRETHDGFDLVINCAGNIAAGTRFRESRLLGPHIDHRGHVIASKYGQLYGNPHLWATGRCTNTKWVRSIGASDYQTRTMFRNLLSVATLVDATQIQKFVPTLVPVARDSFTFPRIIVPFDEIQAVGSTAWSGSVVGPTALKELSQDRKHFLRDFQKPIFYKPHSDIKVRNSVDGYLEAAATDPTDFDIEDSA